MTATTNAQIIAAVAALTAEMAATKDAIDRIERLVEKEFTELKATVKSNDDWIRDRKRDGWWLGGALIGLGTFGSWLTNKLLGYIGY